jgi:hypothetical protein
MIILHTNNRLVKWLKMLHVVTVREMLFDASPGRRPDTADDQSVRTGFERIKPWDSGFKSHPRCAGTLGLTLAGVMAHRAGLPSCDGHRISKENYQLQKLVLILSWPGRLVSGGWRTVLYLFNKTNSCTNFPSLFWLKMNLYMFRAVPRPIIRSPLTVHLAKVYVIRFENSFRAGPSCLICEISAAVGFIKKVFVTMQHGHMNVRNCTVVWNNISCWN